MLNNLINIDDVLVSKEILQKNFTCDLDKCKGACCTMESDYGAPLLEEEIEKITSVLPQAKKYLSDVQIEKIEKNGFHFEIDGEIMVKAIDNKDCIFAYYDNDIAKCSIEKVYYTEDTDFIKPLSCHLFPIRINQFGGDILKYEVYDECSGAVALGKITEIPVSEFCGNGLKRKYGESWYNKLRNQKV
ncbi:MAG: DUF3109 family protein [Melioribacteraceae bacterium]|jgi:Fe-S-cluster containining protein|nr:DUF3109 family protein [Melioribacteraceae bacterium]